MHYRVVSIVSLTRLASPETAWQQCDSKNHNPVSLCCSSMTRKDFSDFQLSNDDDDVR